MFCLAASQAAVYLKRRRGLGRRPSADMSRSDLAPAQRMLGGALVLIAIIIGFVSSKEHWGPGWTILALAVYVAIIWLAGRRISAARRRGRD
jgi:hypothetical protein